MLALSPTEKYFACPPVTTNLPFHQWQLSFRVSSRRIPNGSLFRLLLQMAVSGFGRTCRIDWSFSFRVCLECYWQEHNLFTTDCVQSVKKGMGVCVNHSNRSLFLCVSGWANQTVHLWMDVFCESVKSCTFWVGVRLNWSCTPLVWMSAWTNQIVRLWVDVCENQSSHAFPGGCPPGPIKSCAFCCPREPVRSCAVRFGVHVNQSACRCYDEDLDTAITVVYSVERTFCSPNESFKPTLRQLVYTFSRLAGGQRSYYDSLQKKLQGARHEMKQARNVA